MSRTIAELKDRQRELDDAIRALPDGSPRQAELLAEHGEVVAERHALQQRHHELRVAAMNPRAREDGAQFRSTKRPNQQRSATTMSTVPVLGATPQEARDQALGVIENHYPSHLSSHAATRLDNIVRADTHGNVNARYITAVGNPAYLTAFTKMLADPTTGHLRFSEEEVEAVRLVSQVQEERAMSIGTGSAGGFGVPFTLDPSIILTGSGALNPVRDLARVLTITSRDWKGVSSDGVTAGYVAEAVEATDASPTLVQPAISTSQWRAFVPFSIELSQDYAGLVDELTQLIADARSVMDATQFLTGNATNSPGGILNIGGTGGLTTTQRVQTTTVATYAVGDPWLLKAGLAPRFLANTTFAAAPGTWDTTYRFVAQGSTTEPRQFSDGDRGGDFLGRPKVEWSTMATGSTTGTKLIIAGDFKTGYTIVDRLGITAELIPHLFGVTNRFPLGQRGLYVYGRTGAGVVAVNALRYLEVK
jgi:HK97 family phage major capsid protein